MSVRSLWVQAAVVAITLLALALGGSVDLRAQTILAALIGVLMLIAPPRSPLLRLPLLVAGLFFLLAVAAFLPPFGLGSTPWWHYLLFEAHIPPAATRTPQPWLTAQACGLLFVGLAWALYLMHQPWDRDHRVRVAMGLVFGVALLAAVAAAAFVIGFHVPGWTQQENRGWFPNRNQTADVLAVVGVVNYAFIFDRLRKGYRSGYFLLLALIPIVMGLVISYSRAGIMLFFGGLLLWHVWPRPGKAGAASLKWIALSGSLGLMLLAAFLTWGGDTLDRFQDPESFLSLDFSDFRSAIQEDALRFSLQSPLLGVGLGNFEPLFSFSRIDSINANRAVHPESDWLWVACEMGWLAPVLLVIGIRWWFKRCHPLEIKPGESMRRAMMASIVVFLLHGFVDVSGHRPGSLWVVLLLGAMALPTVRAPVPERWTPLLFRGLGAVVLLLSAWWFLSFRTANVPPTTATLDRLKNEIAASGASMAAIEKSAGSALLIAPLEWSIYTPLAYAEVSQPGKMKQALAHFLTARALNPYWIELPIQEGQILTAANQPDLCLDVWRDGLRRAGPQAPEAFREMVGIAGPHSIEREGLAELAFDRIDYLLLILPSSPLAEADALLTHLLQVDPHLSQLSATQREQLFSAWWKQGDQVRLMEILKDHPEWENQGWLYQAQFAAKENDFQRACEIASHWVPAPPMPESAAERPLADLEKDFKDSPDSLTSGMILYFAQMKANDVNDALITLNALLAMPDHPDYLSYLEAQLQASRQDWPTAWKAWQSYLKL